MANDKSSEILRLQKETCLKYGIPEFEPESMVAVALETLGQSPVYGERVVLEEGEKISWFFYCGKFSENKDFFKPVHTEHLSEILPNVIKFLRMPPGSGFVTDLCGDEEIWINENGSVVVKRI